MNLLDERVQLITERLKQQLKSMRIDKGLSKNELANLSQMTVPGISKLEETASQPTIGTIVRLAHALGTSVEALVAEAENVDQVRH